MIKEEKERQDNAEAMPGGGSVDRSNQTTEENVGVTLDRIQFVEDVMLGRTGKRDLSLKV